MPSVLVSMVALTSIAVSPLAADEAQYGPAELLADRAADGFEFVENGSTGELTYDEFVDIAPEAVAHLDPTSTEASNLKAAIRLWASPDANWDWCHRIPRRSTAQPRRGSTMVGSSPCRTGSR